MAPLVGDGVVAGDVGAVVGAGTVPIGVRAVDAGIVVDRAHGGACSVVGVAAGHAGEEIIGLLGAVDLILPIGHLLRCATFPSGRNGIRIAGSLFPDDIAKRYL